jgi:hypothetical protein
VEVVRRLPALPHDHNDEEEQNFAFPLEKANSYVTITYFVLLTESKPVFAAPKIILEIAGTIFVRGNASDSMRLSK